MTATTAASQLAPMSFDTQHEDLIHDVQLDYYGKRLATASSDRTIRIFQVEQNQPEKFICSLSGHEGPVWQVAWAHPKFGSLLASCSYDGNVIIWKESAAAGGSISAAASWAKVKEHRFHEASVNSISWAPHEFGLALACASSDGKVSIVSFDESGQWEVTSFVAHQIGCNAVSWCPSAITGSLLTAKSAINGAHSPQEAPVKRIVTAGCDNLVKIWAYSEGDHQWKLEGDALEGHADWVRDVAWAPNIGVPVNMIASASQDKTVLIWKSKDCSAGSWTKKSLSKEPFADVIWGVSWSVSGNILAVSCGDNKVTLWKENLDGEWECISTMDQTTISSLENNNQHALRT